MSSPAERTLTNMNQIIAKAEELQLRLEQVEQRSQETLGIMKKLDEELSKVDYNSKQLRQEALQLIISHLKKEE